MSSRLEIIVVRYDGKLAPVSCEQTEMVAVCRRALEVTQTLAIKGCPFGDPEPPRCVNVLEDGRLMLSVAVAPMMKPGGAPRP